MSTPFKFLLFVALFAAAYFLCDQATWGFTTARLPTTQDLGFSPPQNDPPPYLQQKFYLRDQGGQSYVFISEDGKYVLKFFKDMPRPWLRWPSYQKKKFGKLKRTLTGYQLAYDRLREETGLLYLHLSPSSSPLPALLIDRLHITHTLDLSSVYFVLQKRAEPLTSPQNFLPQIQQLLQKRSSAQIADHDPRLHFNLGWIDHHLVFIDPGRFTHDPSATSELPAKFLEHLP
ncbi:MAG: hypothetical protein JSS10_07815 [Verrucomicrobia bacterium]|nr:hypothetical protein [Verrucomicrobiota bacterium]